MELSLDQQILIRQKKMEEIRRFYEVGIWGDVTRFVNPRREDITDASRTNSKGQRHGKDIYDGTGLGALNTWADGMQGFLVSKNWFKSEMSNPALNKIDDVRLWLQAYDRKMYSAFERGNFYSVLAEWFRDAGSIGTATLYTEEELGTGRIIHLAIHPREVFIAENQFGEVDTVHRKFVLTARAAYQKFGEGCSEKIKNNAENHPDKEHEIIHAVFPNSDRAFGKRTSSNKEFRSIYLEVNGGDNKTSKILRDSGYDVMPYAVWRFRKSSDEIYGRSPAADSLVEVFNLNQMGKTLLMAGQMSVDPALNVPEEMRGRVRNEPHGYNYYSQADRKISPVSSGMNYPIGIDQQERLQKSLEDKYRVEFFKAFIGRQGEATATEIMAIKGEQAGLMSAQTDRLYIEGLRKIFDIVAYIEERRGAFTEEAGMPPLPQEIMDSGGWINFILTGPLAQAQRRVFELQPITATLEAMAPMAEILGPEFFDVINKDELSEIVIESGSFPQRAINGIDKRRAMREARAQAQAQAQQAEMLQGMTKPVDVAKKPEEGSIQNAIGEMIG